VEEGYAQGVLGGLLQEAQRSVARRLTGVVLEAFADRSEDPFTHRWRRGGGGQPVGVRPACARPEFREPLHEPVGFATQGAHRAVGREGLEQQRAAGAGRRHDEYGGVKRGRSGVAWRPGGYCRACSTLIHGPLLPEQVAQHPCLQDLVCGDAVGPHHQGLAQLSRALAQRLAGALEMPPARAAIAMQRPQLPPVMAEVL
jgi:hypothetical protein